MSLTSPNDILLPDGAGVTVPRAKLAAFVPITVALLGVLVILFGGLSARGSENAASSAEVDPINVETIAVAD